MFRALAPGLCAKGWRAIIPLVPNHKRPAISEWERFNVEPPSEQAINNWRKYFENSGVGLCAGPDGIIGVDLDFLDPQTAKTAWEITLSILGPTPLIRVGLAPKRMAFYQFDKSAILPGRSFGGFELFARSGQTVLFAVHPDTLQEYEWIGDGGATPMDIGPRELPVARPASIGSLIEALSELARRNPTKPRRGPLTQRAVPVTYTSEKAASDRTNGCVAAIAPALRLADDPLKAAAEFIRESGHGGRHPTMMGAVTTLTEMGFSDNEIIKACCDEYVSKFHAPRARFEDFMRAMEWARGAIGSDRETLLATPQMKSIASKWRPG